VHVDDVGPVDRRLVEPPGEVVLDGHRREVGRSRFVAEFQLRRPVAGDQRDFAVDAGRRRGSVIRNGDALAVWRSPRAVDCQSMVAGRNVLRDGDAAERRDRLGIALCSRTTDSRSLSIVVSPSSSGASSAVTASVTRLMTVLIGAASPIAS